MTTSKDVVSSDTAMEAMISDQDLKASEPFPLRQLPLELRRKIYRHNLMATRNPSPKAIYLKKLPDGLRDPPSALLLVNSQVRTEVLDLVQTWPIFLRVTHQGIQFGSVAETCFIAQQCSRDYGSIHHLVVEIWPPHPDRPTDAIDIWRHLRNLRAELRAVPLLQRISFLFADNEMASWTHNGNAIDLLDSGGYDTEPLAWCNDVTYIMDLFARISAASARFYLPHGLKPGETTEHVRTRLRSVNAMIMGRIPIVEETYTEEDEERAVFQDWVDDCRESKLRMKGAEIARDKLDVMTRQGRMQLTQGQWEDFIAVWSPHFESLLFQEFKGKLHYV